MCQSFQDVEIDEEVDVIISEWMGYMLLYEVLGGILTLCSCKSLCCKYFENCIMQVLSFTLNDIFVLRNLFLVEHAWECNFCKRSLAKTWWSYSSFICDGIISFSFGLYFL